MLIGLSGFMGSGKDAVGEILARKLEFRRTSFAGALKDEISLALRTMLMPEGLHPIGREAFIACLALDIIDPYKKPTSPEMRLLMQQWGTEFRRRQDENYWRKKVQHAWHAMGRPNTAVTDVRFVNEQDWVRSEGGISLLVDGRSRPLPMTLHLSEQLPNMRNRFDVIVDNTQDDPGLVALERTVTELYQELLNRQAAA